MSGISNYTLNQKISNLQGLIGSVTLDAVLASGNDAGAQSITNLNDVALTTINGSAYPPAVVNIDVTDINSDAVFYPTFVDSAGTSKIVYADTTTLPISVNPSTGEFNVVDTLKLDGSRVAVGKGAGLTAQNNNAVAIGLSAGNSSQGSNAVAVGLSSGNSAQGNNSIAVGNGAGQTSQGGNSIAVGISSGNSSQGSNSIAVGRSSGNSSQGNNAVAIGIFAGQTSQGESAVAIGNRAGQTNQHANSIILNGGGTAFNTDGINRFFVKPVRGVAHGLGVGVMKYDPTTGEITYSTN